MKRRIMHLVAAVVAAPFAAALLAGAPAHADPISGTSSTVEMPMPGSGQPSGADGPSYQPPSVSMAVQDGAGGVDRDGTTGMIDTDGTTGLITGPLLRAAPGIRANPAPMSPHVRS